jgi:[1-hydroxy-2-(trimethylamino)ethyl]phosphonate dioxygenase
VSVDTRSVQPARNVGEVVELYRRWGSDPYDEELSQLDHALQTAALARDDGAPDDLIVAALLHDVGHLLHLRAHGSPPGASEQDREHESVGARYLGRLFGPSVTAPIALHVRAKRYLCGSDPTYLAGLSRGSRASLERQGGPMLDHERAAFDSNPSAADGLRLRRWDDGGKVLGLSIDTLDDYVPLLEDIAARR